MRDAFELENYLTALECIVAILDNTKYVHTVLTHTCTRADISGYDGCMLRLATNLQTTALEVE